MNTISIEKLMQTPVCMMTGEQLAVLMSNLSLLSPEKVKSQTESKSKNVAFGIKGIADTFGCSIPTANRIKKSGVIDAALSQVGRKIVVDVDKALQLVTSNKKSIL